MRDEEDRPTGHAAIHKPALPRIAGAPTQALFAATLGFFVGFAAVSLFGPTAQLLNRAMDLTPTQVGLLVAIPAATGSLLRIPFGAWVDSAGGRTPMLTLLILSALGMGGLLVLLAAKFPDGLTAAHYPLLLLLGMLCGCGIATFSVGIGQVSYWHRQACQGQALAIYAGFGNVAPGLFALLIPLAVARTSLATAYAIWLAMLVLGIIAYAAWAHDAPYFQFRHKLRAPPAQAARWAFDHGQELMPAGGMREGLARTIGLGRTWALIGLYFTSFGGFLALTAWLPTYWYDRFGFGLTAAGALTMGYSVLASLIRVPGGFLSDRMGGETTALAAFAVMAAGAVIVALAAAAPVAVVGTTVMAVGMGGANAAVFKLVPKYLATVAGGAGAGWVGGLGALGGLVLPPALGGLVEGYGAERGYLLGFGLFAFLALGSALTTLILRRRLGPARLPADARGPMTVFCPHKNRPAEVWAAAASGETAPVRLVFCSLVDGEPTCDAACLERQEQRRGADPSTSRPIHP
ncbi:MAG: nitrate/nitrite transporter [Parvularculaceae bacterium]